MNGIERLSASGAVQPEEIHGVAHATTLVTNTLIERKGAATGCSRPRAFAICSSSAATCATTCTISRSNFRSRSSQRSRRLGIHERVGADGVSLARPDPGDVRKAVAALVKDGVKSIAVCFLHSYRNPSHEKEVLEVIRSEFPQVDVSISSTVAPEIREYERTVTGGRERVREARRALVSESARISAR